MKKLLYILTLALALPTLGWAQADTDWFNLDFETDSVYGMGVNKAYELLEGKTPTPVVVAVIDSGIDIEHEDLAEVIWTNDDEIAGNGLDDDKNGYIDDMHGWNFLGSADGGMIINETLEVTRLYERYFDQFDGKDESEISKKDMELYEDWLGYKEEVVSSMAEAKPTYDRFKGLYEMGSAAEKALIEEYGEDYTQDQVMELAQSTEDEALGKGLGFLASIMSNGYDLSAIEGYVDYLESQTLYHYNVDYDIREEVVGDDPTDWKESDYGNADVYGREQARHGTHVAGIIAAVRDNDIGMNGVANAVEIMVLRTVPNGDERDKDVANSIIYAVDNGARVINMSFGKSYSPEKKAVDKAMKYAEKKGVLLVHAAGNDGHSIDEEPNFPTHILDNGKKVSTYITVGNSTVDADHLAASSSNYGVNNVDVFAPGSDIYATTPENTYESLTGTSMASPAVAGVAALIMSYFPDFSAEEVKQIILDSATPLGDLEVVKPGSATQEMPDGEKVPFSELSSTGGVVNAYQAVKLAMERSK